MKKPKQQHITGVPIILMEGGIVQDVFLPQPKGKQPFTPIHYDLVDMDVLQENSDEEIADHWNNLSPASMNYFIAHQTDTYAYSREAIDRLKAKTCEHRVVKRFTGGESDFWTCDNCSTVFEPLIPKTNKGEHENGI